MLQKKHKECSKCGLIRLIAKGYSTRTPLCFECLYKQSPKGTPPGLLRHFSANTVNNKPSPALSELRKKDWEVGRQIWSSQPHRCEECNVDLGDVLRKFMLSHNLAKHHTDIRHDPDNISLLCFNCHQRWETGDRRGMKIYPKKLPYMEKHGFIERKGA